MKLPINGLIHIFNKNFYMLETRMEQLSYILQHDIVNYKKYIKFSKKGYKRNVVYRNHLFEISVLCWQPGQQSTKHTHPTNGCLMKVLEGSLVEERYILDKVQKNVYKENRERHNGDVTFIRGGQEHSIKNNSKTKNLVTLHIYSPPNYYSKL